LHDTIDYIRKEYECLGFDIPFEIMRSFSGWLKKEERHIAGAILAKCV